MTASTLFKKLQLGDRVALGQAITLVESTASADFIAASEVLDLATKAAADKTTFRIGITGVPGVGKSTLIEVLGSLIIADGHKVAVLAIDPSSLQSRGSILGDKTRMETLGRSENAFIRPTASRGHLGGIAFTTREAITLCEAAGFDHILVETVGVGQSEIEVHRIVDCFLLLMLAGAGDELQGIKRGIMEMADIISINKAESPNDQLANQAKSQLESAMHYLQMKSSSWTPPVLTCSAIENIGVDDLWDQLKKFESHISLNNWKDDHRIEQAQEGLKDLVQINLMRQFEKKLDSKLYETLLKQVRNGDLSLRSAANQLIAMAI